MRVTAFDGSEVALTEERWRHIVFRHPELKPKMQLILDAVAHPDEVYVDTAGDVHALKHLENDVSDYVVVIYKPEDAKRGYIRTAYYTNTKGKVRRYRLFRKLKLS